MVPRSEDRKAPKPRAPARARATVKGAAAEGERERAPAPARVTTAGLSERIDGVAAAVSRIEGALSPGARAADVAAEEHALLNLLDAIVDRRTEAVLGPVARLAATLERAAAEEDGAEKDRLLGEALEGLRAVVESLGLERIAPSRGERFEPLLHEEVEQAEAEDLDEGRVVRVVRAGYRVRGGRVLLPARVAVSPWTEP